VRDRRFVAEGALVLAAFFFGSTFVLVQDAIEDITPLGYLLLRFSVGVVALAPFAIVILLGRRSQGPGIAGPQALARPARSVRSLGPLVTPRLLWRTGLVAGALLFTGYVLQTVGLQYTESSTSAFITGLYVVFTPIVEATVRRRLPPPGVCVGIVVATVGLFLLTGAELALGRGELLTLGCAATFAIWIVYQGGFADRLHPVPFATVQMGVIAVLALPPTAATGIGELTALALFAAVFTGIACSSVALSLQLFGQRRVSPSRSALILLMEPVFAGIFGYAAGERLGALKLAGAVVILGGIAIAEVAPGGEAASRPMDATARAS
jgi:drug/metabolite transporter (DMT)-like permease